MVDLTVKPTRYPWYMFWAFVPAFPFEVPKEFTGRPPFYIIDYIESKPLALKAATQISIIAIIALSLRG